MKKITFLWLFLVTFILGVNAQITLPYSQDFSALTSGDMLSSTTQGTAINLGTTSLTGIASVAAAYPAGGVVKFGTGSIVGGLTTELITATTDSIRVTFKAVGWGAASPKPVQLTVTYGTVTKTVELAASHNFPLAVNDLAEKSVTFLANNTATDVVITSTYPSSSYDRRYFLDDLSITGFNAGLTSLSEGFEDATFPPTGWTRNSSGVARITTDAVIHSGTAGVRMSVGSNEVNYLVTPLLSINASNKVLAFWERQGYLNNYITGEVHILTDISELTGADILTPNAELAFAWSANYTLREIDLSSYIGSNVYVVFVARGGANVPFPPAFYAGSLDDVSLQENLTPPPPFVIDSVAPAAGNLSLETEDIKVYFNENITDALPATLVQFGKLNFMGNIASNLLDANKYSVSGNVLTIDLTGLTLSTGNYKLIIPGAKYQNAAGETITNASGFPLTYTVEYSVIIAAAPTFISAATSNFNDESKSLVNGASIEADYLTAGPITLTFSETVTKAVGVDVTLSNGSVSTVLTVTPSAMNATMQLLQTGSYNWQPGNYTLTIPAGAFIDQNENRATEAATVITFTVPAPPVTGLTGLTVQIGAGTNTTANSGNIPWFYNYDNTFSQQIYTAAEIIAANDGFVPSDLNISKLAWKSFAVSTRQDIQVSIMHTTVNTFSAFIDPAAAQVVYTSAERTFAAGVWEEFEFSTPFVWDGTSNIVVTVASYFIWNGADVHSANFSQHSATTQARYVYKDGATHYSATVTNTGGSNANFVNDVQFFFPDAALPSCPKPINLTVSAADLTAYTANVTWTAGGSETEWVVEYKKSSETTTWLTLSPNPTVTASALLTGLEATTEYNVRVKAICSASDESGWTAAVNFTTPCGVTPAPWNEGFENITTGVPDCWTRVEGLVTFPMATPTTTNTQWGYTNDGTKGLTGKHIRINNFGTSRKAWVITPAIDLGDAANNYQLTFDVSLTAYVGGATNGTGVDDKFYVMISTDGGNNWLESNATKWDNAGSANVYNNISVTGQEIVIPLTSYTGIIKVAFYAESTISNADDYLSIDNVKIDNIPNCEKPTALAASATGITWTGAADSYDVVISTTALTDPSTGTIVNTAASPYLYNTWAQNVTTYIYVRAHCGADVSEWISTTYWYGYCMPTASTSLDGLLNVTFSGINNTSSAVRYEDYTALTGGDVSAGTTLSISTNYDYANHYLKIYVDWNNDLDFDDAEETIITKSYTAKINTATYDIPAGTPVGAYRMRVVAGDGEAKVISCPTATYVEVEDYTLNVLAAPSCLPVSAGVLTGLTSTSASITWAAGTGTAWNVILSDSVVTDFAAWTPEQVTSAAYSNTNLAPSTNYHFYVQTDCGATDGVSQWGYFGSAKTLCAAEELDYIETFTTAANFNSSCWTKYYNASYSGWNTAGTAGFSSGNIKINVYGTGTQYVVSPPINLGDGRHASLKFRAAVTDYGSSSAPSASSDLPDADDVFAVLVSTDGTLSLSNAVKIWDNSSADNKIFSIPNTGEEFKVDLSAYSGEIQLAFVVISTVSTGDYDIHFDSIVVAEGLPEVTPIAYLPALNETNVASAAPVVVTFDKKLFTTDTDFSGITIKADGNNTNFFTEATIDNNKLTLSHTPFTVGAAVYTVTIPVGAVGGLYEPIVWSFTLETFALPLDTYTPANSATNVEIQQVISVRVNYATKLTGVDWSGVTVKAEGDNTNYADDVLISNPTMINRTQTISIYTGNDGLPYNKLITVTIPKTAIPAQGGYELKNDIVWSFKTAVFPLEVTDKTPAANSIDVEVNSPVKVKFNNVVNINGAPNLNGVTISGAMGVTASYSDSAVIIAHADFLPDTAYTVTIPAGAIKGINSDISWTFNTGNATILIDSVSPENGATNVAVNTPITVSFSRNPYINAEPDWSLVTVKDASNKLVDGILISGAGISGNTYNIFHATLAAKTVYTVTIPKEAVTGMKADYSWTFTTGDATGLDNETANITVYPTVTDGTVFVNTGEKAEIRVFDLTGKTLDIRQSAGGSYELNFAEKSAGIYFVAITANNKTSVTKIIRK
jgi:hypothetical protein